MIAPPPTASSPESAGEAAPGLPPLFAPPRRRLVVWLIGLGLAQAGLAAAVALGIRTLFNMLGDVNGGPAPFGHGPVGPMLALGGVAMAAALATMALRQWAGRLAESLGQQYVSAVRLVLLQHLFELPPRRHQRMRHGHLMARLTGDLGALHRWAGRTVAPLLVGAASFVAFVATLLWMAPWVALVTLLACVPLGAWAWAISARLERALRAERAQRWGLAGQVGERLAEAAVVQAHGQAARELRRVRRRQQRLHDTAVLRAREMALLKSLPPAMATLLLGVLAGWGSWQVANGAWTSGTLAGLLTLLGLVLAPLRDFAKGLGGWRSWRVSREKLMSFLHNTPLRKDEPPPNMPIFTGGLALDSLTALPGMRALSATLRCCETLALQGGSGSGKSAVLEVIAGLLRPVSGRALVRGPHGMGAACMTHNSGVVLVSADLPLLRGSVAGNLRYRRRNVSSEEMEHALSAAGVRSLPSGAALDLSSSVAEGGRNLPRMLRARLAFARALADAPTVLLIDDFDEMLEGEAKADAALAALLAEPPCVIVIATRRPEWAARCAHQITMEASSPPAPRSLGLVNAA
jgi:ATP-binding cassette subfamily B protein